MIIKSRKSIRAIREEAKAWEAHQKNDHPEFFKQYLSRRELFEKGFTGLTATLMAPSLLSLLMRSQEAQAAVASQVPSFIFTISGGASFGPEVVLSDINGNLTLTAAAHQQLSGGLQTTLTMTNPISSKYGAGLWTRGLLFNALEGTPLPVLGNGIQISAASQKVRDNLKIVVFQHARTDDDSRDNPNVPSHLIAASALQATNTAPLVRAIQMGSSSEAGGNGAPTMAFPGFKPGSGNSLADLSSLTSLNQGALASYSDSQMRGLSQTIANFVQEQRNSSMMNRNGGVQKFVTSAQEAAENVKKIVENPPNINVSSDPAINTAFSTSVNGVLTAPTGDRLTLATNVKFVLDGVAPVAVINQQGYDYHGNPASVQVPTTIPGVTSQTSSGLRWRESLHPNLIDATIRTLNAMAAKNKSGIISWVTDGSVRFSTGATTDLASATGEGGQVGHTAVMFIYSDPGAALPQVQRFYLGGFDPRLGGAITDTNLNILARGPQYEGLAIYATYLGSRGGITYDKINDDLLPPQLNGDRAFINNLLQMNMFIR